MDRKKLNIENVFAEQRQCNNRLFEQHRKDILPHVEAMKSHRNKAHSQSVDGNLSAEIDQAYSLIDAGLDRNYYVLNTVEDHSTQLKQDDVIGKYIEAGQSVLAKIDALNQHRQQLDSFVAEIKTRIGQIIADVAGVDEGESREFKKNDDAVPVVHSEPKEKIVKADKKNNSSDDKAFEKGILAKAAGLGFPPEAIAKAKKKL